MEREGQVLDGGRLGRSASPTRCLKCGQLLSPGAPEPSWCPNCGALCSAFDVPDDPPDPDEIPETPQEQRRLRVWFVVLFLAGPVAAGFAFILSGRISSLLPGTLQPLSLGGLEPLLALFAGAGGAGFCLARMWYPRRSLGAQLVFGVGMGAALMFAYLGLAAVLLAFIHIFFHKL